LTLTPELLEKTQIAAQQRGDSISALVRTALEKYLTKPKTTSLLDEPVVLWSPAEKDYADKALKNILMKTATRRDTGRPSDQSTLHLC